MNIFVINGPNLNFLGIREKGIYGNKDFSYLLNYMEDEGKKRGVIVSTYQSNCEGHIIDRIQQAHYENIDGIIINPGAYTHYSYAIHDALASVSMPKIEVHISNVHKREEFRHKSVTASACDGQIVGLGLKGYILAMDAIIDIIANRV